MRITTIKNICGKNSITLLFITALLSINNLAYSNPENESFDASDIVSNVEIEQLQKDAYLGDCNSLFKLGQIYLRGEFVPQDYSKAIEYFTDVFNQGDQRGRLEIGHMYELGIGVEQDLDKALEYYSDSCELSNHEENEYQCKDFIRLLDRKREMMREALSSNDPAQVYELANIYYYGYYFEQNINEAKDLYEKAANLNYAPAQTNLGIIYINGIDGIQDYQEAKKWLEKASNNGDIEAKRYLLEMNN